MKKISRLLLALSGALMLQSVYVVTILKGNFFVKILFFILYVGLLTSQFKKDIDKNLDS